MRNANSLYPNKEKSPPICQFPSFSIFDQLTCYVTKEATIFINKDMKY